MVSGFSYMAGLPPLGKITRDFFDRVIYPNLGASRNEVLVGPAPGVDCCVVKIASNEVLIATTDPLSFIPELGPEDSAWLSVNLVASDIATSGFRPQYALFDFNLPPSMPTADFERYWHALSEECKRLGIAIIGGHTGKFAGLDYTIIGASTMFSIGSLKTYVTSSDAVIGDKIIVTKGAAIAATGILSRVFPNTIGPKIGKAALRKAIDYFKEITVIDDALTAVKVGVRAEGVTAMHDATEGGVLSAIYELASASTLGAKIELSQIPLSSETKALCNVFGMDPYITLSEGSLVISCVTSKAEELLSLLGGIGIHAKVVWQLTRPDDGIKILDESRAEIPINYPVVDPYWQAYSHAKNKGWT